MKGQGAIEYMVILGAVLAVGLAAVSIMAALPALGQASAEQQTAQYWLRATPFSITAFRLGGGNLSLSVANNAKNALSLTGIEIGAGAQVIAFWVPDSSQDFRPGQEVALANGSFGFSGNPCYGKALGAYYEFRNLTFIYTEGTIPGMRQVGLGLAGRCSQNA